MSEPLYGIGSDMADRMEEAWEADKAELYKSFLDLDAYDIESHTLTQDDVKMLQEIISELNAEAQIRHDRMNADSANLEGPSAYVESFDIPF